MLIEAGMFDIRSKYTVSWNTCFDPKGTPSPSLSPLSLFLPFSLSPPLSFSPSLFLPPLSHLKLTASCDLYRRLPVDFR